MVIPHHSFFNFIITRSMHAHTYTNLILVGHIRPAVLLMKAVGLYLCVESSGRVQWNSARGRFLARMCQEWVTPLRRFGDNLEGIQSGICKMFLINK